MSDDMKRYPYDGLNLFGSAKDRTLAPVRAQLAGHALKAAGYAFSDPEKALAEVHACEIVKCELAELESIPEIYYAMREALNA